MSASEKDLNNLGHAHSASKSTGHAGAASGGPAPNREFLSGLLVGVGYCY